jgi:hypothetical protein
MDVSDVQLNPTPLDEATGESTRVLARRQPPLFRLERENPTRLLIASYCTTRLKVVLCVSDPLVAVTVTGKVPVGVPVTTEKFTALDMPPPGAGFVTAMG